MNFETITNPRIIRGIFAEIQQLHREITVEDIGIVSSVILESSSGSDYMLSLPESGVSADVIQISFWIGREYFRCTLKQATGQKFHPPAEIQVVNRRNRTRIESSDISLVPILSVLSTMSSKQFGKLECLDSDFISVVTNAHSLAPERNSYGVLSNYFEGKLIGIHHVLVAQTTVESNRSKLLLNVVQRERIGRRLATRGESINSVTFNLFWPDEDGVSVAFLAKELTGLGISGKLIGVSNELFPSGTIFLEKASGARLRLAWKNEETIGFSFDTSSPGLREALLTFYNGSKSEGASISVREKGLRSLSMLTRAGLLKGERASSYSDEHKKEIFLYRSGVSKRWFFQNASDDHHISFVRISDDGWVIQELGSLKSSKGFGESLILDGIKTFRNERCDELSPQSSIIGIYDIKSRFNIDFWRSKIYSALDYQPIYFRVTLGSIKKTKLPEQAGSKKSTVHIVTPDSWYRVFRNIQALPVSRLLSVFGISNSDYTPRLLSEILLSDSKRLEREVYIVGPSESEPLGILVKIGLPPLANVTSLVENLFIIPLVRDHGMLIKEIFFENNSALIGVEDICFLDSSAETDISLQNMIPGFEPREFEMACIDLYAVKEK